MLNYFSSVPQSYSVAFADYVRVAERKGQNIIKMQTGEPDFVTHPNICEAACSAITNGETRYCDSRGIQELREALADKLMKNNGINCSAADNILLTHGAVHGICMAIRAILNPGDECIILEPYWRSYEMNVILAGGVPVIHRSARETGFQLDAQSVLQRISSRTKAIIINTPNNPTGAVYSRHELMELASGAAQRGVYIISDEVYEAIIFDGGRHYSVAADADIAAWTISVFSFSKTYAMTGWRVGYLVAGKRVIDEILKLSQFSITSLSSFTQRAALSALCDPVVQEHVKWMQAQYGERRETIAALIDGTWLEEAILLPEGTFYALIDVSSSRMPSTELAKKLLDSANVAFTPGVAFGNDMDGYLRMCFATSEENIKQAINALVDYL